VAEKIVINEIVDISESKPETPYEPKDTICRSRILLTVGNTIVVEQVLNFGSNDLYPG